MSAVVGLEARRVRKSGECALRRASTVVTFPLPPMDLARRLLLEADVELQAGHHEAGERLAHRAMQLRGFGA